MAGVQIFTESPISTAVKNETSTPTTSADPPQPVTTAQIQPPPTSATFLPAEPSINPPTPQTGSFPQSQAPKTNYAPPTSIPASQSTQQRSNSLTPFAPDSPNPSAASSLDAPQAPRSRSVSPSRIPPPPKVGEKMMPASYYSPAATPTYGTQTASYNQTFPYQTGATPNTATFAQQHQQQQQQGLLSPHPNGLFSPAPYQPSGNISASPAQTPTTATNPAFRNQAQPQQTNFEHPPGYVQNPYAADMTPEQRFATQHGARSPTLGYNSGPGGSASPNPFSSFASAGSAMARPSVGGGDNRSGVLDSGIDGAGVWGVVSGWAKTVTKKASEVEGEVWKRINGDQ